MADEPPIEQPSPDKAPEPRKRPYKRPTLKHLGSVRELTFGGTRGMAEGAGTFRAAM